MSLIIKEVQTIIGARDSWHIHKLRSILLPVRASEQDKVIGVGVRIYMFVDKKNIFESCFSYRLTISNICSRTSRKIYRLALPLLSPETLSS